jgi:hypothetical protein
MMINDRGDGLVNRACLPLQVAASGGPRAGQSPITIDGHFEYLA